MPLIAYLYPKRRANLFRVPPKEVLKIELGDTITYELNVTELKELIIDAEADADDIILNTDNTDFGFARVTDITSIVDDTINEGINKPQDDGTFIDAQGRVRNANGTFAKKNV